MICICVQYLYIVYTIRIDGGSGASFTPDPPPNRSVLQGVCTTENPECRMNANLIGVYFNIIPKVVRAYLFNVVCVCVCRG